MVVRFGFNEFRVRTVNHQCWRVETKVCEITQIRIVNSEISEDDDDSEDRNTDGRCQRIDADEKHQTFLKGSAHLKKKKNVQVNFSGCP